VWWLLVAAMPTRTIPEPCKLAAVQQSDKHKMAVGQRLPESSDPHRQQRVSDKYGDCYGDEKEIE